MVENGGEKPLKKMSEAFNDLAITVNSQDLHLQLAPFCHACSLVSPLLSFLGIAFMFAEMDYVNKVNDLAETSNSITTLQALIDQDIQANTVRKLGSHTRNLLRVKRSLDMIKVLFEKMIATKGDSLEEAAFDAYTQVFEQHHGAAIRKAVGDGMYALPTRPQLMSKLNEDENSACILMQNYITSSTAVIRYVEKLFLSNELGLNW
ncbi:hypothetical protein BVRB_004550 [Beta vulgaris subsp. vulgaris]|uniref:Glycolipid transfer protein domain-containing protein n=1 Tax=Beta vulgaris subsp. vulgaris TaxID=3555 RepID=A0A0J8B4A6_BETVV|nr:hypothetical protein BVRB_004550 [Beta vulgaris subsp. vulgaris]